MKESITHADEKLKTTTRVFNSLLVLVFVAIALIYPATPSDKQEVFARKLNMDGYAFIKYACKEQSICQHYAGVRFSCAAAGNIDRCIDIKMENDNYSVCTTDGKLAGVDSDVMPGTVQCFGNRVVTLFQPK